MVAGEDRTKDRIENRIGDDDLALVPVGRAFRAMLKAFERDTGVSAPRWFVLTRVVEEEGVSQGEVCRIFGQDPSRITRLAQGLENDGLIRRRRDPGDNRVVRMYSTEEGRTLVREFPERRAGFDRRVGRAMGDEELAELRRLLGALTDEMKD